MCSGSFSRLKTTCRADGVNGTDLSAQRHRARAGLLYGLSAYTMWGAFPLYFHLLADVPPWIVVCHRVGWSALLVGGSVSLRKEWRAVGQILRLPRSLALLAAAAVLIAVNWLIYIYAVGHGQTLQASLGYFMNPLLSIVLGMLFFRERLRLWQWVAVIIALVGVANLALCSSGFPWIAVSLAFSFGFYGFVRKKVDVNPLHALLVESAVLLPLALAAPALLQTQQLSTATWGILSLSGVITAVPLLCFGAAVRSLQLTTIGFLQYVSPTLQFLIALWVLREPLNTAKLGSFILCWIAIGLYVLDSILNARQQIVGNDTA